MARSGSGTGIGRPWRSIANDIAIEELSRSASSSLSAAIAHTPIATCGFCARSR